MLRNDVRLTRWVQEAPVPAGEHLAWFGNWGGSFPVAATVAAAVAFLLLTRHHPQAAAIVLVATVVRSTNGLLKALFESPRPTERLVVVTENAEGLGFPSGHAMGVVLCYGAIAVVASRVIARPWPRRAVRAGAVLMLLLTAFGRIHTGAHWPSDVLGGIGWGLLFLVAVVAAVDALYRRLSRSVDPPVSGRHRTRILPTSSGWAHAPERIEERPGVGSRSRRSGRRPAVDAEGA